MEFCRASALRHLLQSVLRGREREVQGGNLAFCSSHLKFAHCRPPRRFKCNNRKEPASPSLSLPASPELQSCTAALDYFFISYSSLPSIRSPRTNQAALWGRTPAAFNKVWLPYRQVHTAVLDVACHSTERKRVPTLGYLYEVSSEENQSFRRWRQD